MNTTNKPGCLGRREFIYRTGLAAGAALNPLSIARANVTETASTQWPIGCFNRPWANWCYDEALDELKSAGFTLTGLVGRPRSKPEPLLSPDATGEYLDELKDRIQQRGLKPIIAWIYGPKSRDRKSAIAELKKIADRAGRLELEYLMSGGPRRNQTVEDYGAVMAEGTSYAADKGIRIAMKPHGGDGAEIRRCLELVNHSNFSIWYDAGNIVYYTGEDPVSELKGLAPHVTGFCAKDCAAKGSPVMIQFGTGKANFPQVFQVLKDAGFNGPVMIECTGEPESPEDATRKAVANRDYLKKVFSELK